MNLPARLLLLFLALGLSASAAPEPPPTVVESQQLDMKSTDDDTTFLFTGLVTVTGNNLQLTCDRLEVIALRSGHDNDRSGLGQIGKFQSMVATGRVKIVQADRVATCGRAEVLPGEEKIVLTDKPMVRDGDSTVAGDRISLFRGERRAVVESGANGPVRITLPPVKDLGFPKDQPAPKAP